jgi:hypothetical protein
LLIRAVGAIAHQATSQAMYLWVLEQNTSAQLFYRAHGATCVETMAVSPPGGVPTRLNGAPRKQRMAWSSLADQINALSDGGATAETTALQSSRGGDD